MQPGQDWNPVIISKNKKGRAGGSSGGGGGGGGGGPAPGEKKFAAGSNQAGRAGGNMVKLDQETEALSHRKVGLGLGKAIQQGRAAKGLTQAKLAQAINEKPAVINQYESGKAIPNGQIIAKIERALGCKLPRPPKK